jgi:hypothetical protein
MVFQSLFIDIDIDITHNSSIDIIYSHTAMRPTIVNLAKSVSKRPLRLRKASAELLPPIP